MIWYADKTRSYTPWCKHRLDHEDMSPLTFRHYTVRIRMQIFKEHTEEFQQIYERERTWQRLRHT